MIKEMGVEFLFVHPLYNSCVVPIPLDKNTCAMFITYELCLKHSNVPQDFPLIFKK